MTDQINAEFKGTDPENFKWITIRKQYRLARRDEWPECLLAAEIRRRSAMPVVREATRVFLPPRRSDPRRRNGYSPPPPPGKSHPFANRRMDPSKVLEAKEVNKDESTENTDDADSVDMGDVPPQTTNSSNKATTAHPFVTVRRRRDISVVPEEEAKHGNNKAPRRSVKMAHPSETDRRKTTVPKAMPNTTSSESHREREGRSSFIEIIPPPWRN